MQANKQPTLGNEKICYIEIPAIDINSSATFYKEIFGWRLRYLVDESIAFDDTVGEVSGTWITGRKPATEIGFVISIMVDSVEATLKDIMVKGGKMIQPIGMDAPEITARFSDPAGNIIGLYQVPT